MWHLFERKFHLVGTLKRSFFDFLSGIRDKREKRRRRLGFHDKLRKYVGITELRLESSFVSNGLSLLKDSGIARGGGVVGVATSPLDRVHLLHVYNNIVQYKLFYNMAVFYKKYDVKD